MRAAKPTDFNLWIQRTVQLLRDRHWQEIDVDPLIKEVEDLGKSERRGIFSQLTRLLLHLLRRERDSNPR